MQEITTEILETKDDFLLYIHTPFCGTCHVARAMLQQIEQGMNKSYFYEMNGSYYETFLHEQKIQSVPCLLFKVNGEYVHRIYTFYSVANMLSEIATYDLARFEIESGKF